MKKIPFNDCCGLTGAVQEKRKTMTRRAERIDFFPGSREEQIEKFCKRSATDAKGRQVWLGFDNKGNWIAQLVSHYAIGEEIAVAQSYKDIVRIANKDDSVWQFLVEKDVMQSGGAINTEFCSCAGWTNKMFVRADLMPHRIRITDIKVERLQDISDEDCMKEGVEKWMDCYIVTGIMYRDGKSNVCFDTSRAAFAALIDKVSGKETWERNPWVFVYEFELVK